MGGSENQQGDDINLPYIHPKLSYHHTIPFPPLLQLTSPPFPPPLQIPTHCVTIHPCQFLPHKYHPTPHPHLHPPCLSHTYYPLHTRDSTVIHVSHGGSFCLPPRNFRCFLGRFLCKIFSNRGYFEFPSHRRGPEMVIIVSSYFSISTHFPNFFHSSLPHHLPHGPTRVVPQLFLSSPVGAASEGKCMTEKPGIIVLFPLLGKAANNVGEGGGSPDFTDGSRIAQTIFSEGREIPLLYIFIFFSIFFSFISSKTF